MNATISRSIFKFGEQKEKLESDYYRQIEGESGTEQISVSISEGGRLKPTILQQKVYYPPPPTSN